MTVLLVFAYGSAISGCSDSSTSSVATTSSSPDADQDHDHDGHDDDHDHDDHDDDDHDHPAHGPYGGHMVELSNGKSIEWSLDEEAELFSLYPSGVAVESVAVKTTIDGKETVYDFEKSDTPAGPVFGLLSPELATAVKMGEAVKNELVVKTADGELTAAIEHHSH